MSKIKFLQDCGPNWPKDAVVENDQNVQQALAAAGLAKGVAWDDVAVEDVAAEGIRRVIQEATRAEFTRLNADLEKRLSKTGSISLGPEPVDKDPRRGWTSLAEYAYAVYLAGIPGAPRQAAERVADVSRTEDLIVEAQRRLGTTQKAEIASRQAALRALPAGTLSTVTGPAGGYLLPTEFVAELWKPVIEQGIIYPYVQKVPTTHMTIEWPAINDTTHAAGLVYGGVGVYRRAELSQMTATKPGFATMNLQLTEQYVFVSVPNTMLQFSAVSIEPLLTEIAPQALAWKLESEIFSGSGAGQPLGILNAAALVAETRTGATIVWDDIVRMEAHVPSQFDGDARFYHNPDLHDDIRALYVSGGGNTVPLMVVTGGGPAKPFQNLSGYPLIRTEHCEAQGTKGDILLVCPKQYVLAEYTGGLQSAASTHLYFDYNAMAFRFVWYNDGRPVWLSKLTPEHGSVEISPYIALATAA